MDRNKIIISSKIKGEIYTHLRTNPFIGGKTYILTDDEIGHPDIQAMLAKGLAIEEKEILEEKELIVATKNKESVKKIKEESHISSWDAEKQQLLDKEASKTKALNDINSTEIKVQYGEEIDLTDDEYNQEVKVKDDDARVSFKKEASKPIKKKGRPKKNQKTENTKFVYDNEPTENNALIYDGDNPDLASIRLKKRKLTEEEKVAKLQKYLKIENSESSDIVDLNGDVE